MVKGLIEKTITEISDDSVTKIAYEGLYGLETLQRVSFPNVKIVEEYGVRECNAIRFLDLPSVETIGSEAITCTAIEELILPGVKTIEDYAFFESYNLKRVDLACVTKIAAQAFQYCSSLESVIIRTPSVCEAGYAIFGDEYEWGKEDDPDFTFANTSFRIYVPANLVDAYKSATNWSMYADIILPIEE